MKRRIVALLGALAATWAPVHSQEGLPDAVLKELKAATVFIKVVQDQERWTGSGFLFRKDGGSGFIATNAHVADGDPIRRLFTVVFNSGQPQEIQYPATLRAIDHDRDLAVLEVRASALPKPIETRSRKALKETLVVYTVGFPLGGALAVGAKNPEVTFGRSSISSLRQGDSGELLAVQLDGEINPGNSGGPAVDESGDLVGIVYSKIRRTQIGFAIPSRHLDDLALGRAESLSGEISEVTRTDAKIRIRAGLDDPFKRIRSVSVAWAPLEPPPAKAVEWKREPVYPNMKSQQLRMEGDDAWGDISVSSGGKDFLPLVLQTRVVRGENEVAWGYPELVLVNFLESVTPHAEIRMWQDARPGLEVVENKDGKARCALGLDLLIPRKVRSASMIAKRTPLNPRLPAADKIGLRARLPGRVDEHPLSLSDTRAVGELQVSADPAGGPVTLILQGMIEMEDRRKIYTIPSIHVIPFARPGVVRPVTPDDWIVLAMGKNRDAGRGAGTAPVEESLDWGGPSRLVQDASVRTISLQGRDYVSRALWSTDGRFAYLLERNGTVRLMSVPELKQSRRLTIGRLCEALALSQEGLVVHVKEPSEIWLLDLSTLDFKRKVTLDGVRSLAASPGSSMAYASAGEKLYVVDLKAGRVAKQYLARDFTTQNLDKPKKAAGSAPLWAWGTFELASDGATLLMADSQLHRFRVSGTDLAWEEAGPGRTARDKAELLLSPDGKYFAMYEPVPGSMENKTRIGIYSVKDLSGPLLSLPTGTATTKPSFAFDKEAGKMYGSEYGKQIVVYTPKGERARQYEIAPGATVEFMLAHPTGNRVLLATGEAFYWVEFGK